MKKSFGPQTYLPATPVLLVGTYDKEGKPNLMTAAWGGICCSNPVCMTVSLRKATYSYSGIVERKAFTLGVPSQSQVKEADYMGIVSGAKVDKFAEAGYHAAKGDFVDAPYAEEIPLVVECELVESLELGLHTMFVGKVMDVKADGSVLAEDGLPDVSRIKPIVYDPIHKIYSGLGESLGKGFSVGGK
ncbi:NADH-FMN oxidoreductase RutF, flavin reductase (DIM6/NTAB) family [Desulfatibacillum alkenivorans DSM 16219]|uniref:NADH-FMN oxidoreductase RutF, flavin reductase (DIM6/NTAB) family n=1 Tax=Desulfatibacillum alkenivorans DSM 16219 TaxID=1121393 RepID=A0A1M6J557_9BACT|nr:flavin reductase family protein [Desulfatibacillum alkenivorans]SHJ41855.1 NADH-FMN oxidoreductase RutF, flavin reductase (DIM6/NTAB) family [Desulfatibacillum alkenivorans DSM 16219]